MADELPKDVDEPLDEEEEEEEADGEPEVLLLLPCRQVTSREDRGLEFCCVFRAKDVPVMLGPWQIELLLFLPSGHLLHRGRWRHWSQTPPGRDDFAVVRRHHVRGVWDNLDHQELGEMIWDRPRPNRGILQVFAMFEEQGDEFGLSAWTGALLSNKVEFEFVYDDAETQAAENCDPE